MNRHRLLAFVKAEDGSGMVEFALAGAFFFAVLLGIVEFGLAAWAKNTAAADAREGARYAIVRGNTSPRVATADSVRRYIKSRTALDTTRMNVYTSWTPDNKVGSVVSVSVTHTVPRRGPFIPAHKDSVTSKMIIYF
jgi:Flp pilus assembly protein TadG